MDFILLNDDSVIKQQQHVFLGYMLMYDSPHWDWTKHFMGIYGIFFGEYTGEIMGFNRFNPPQVGTYVFSRSSRNCLFSIGLLETVLGKMHCGFTISIPITENRCRIFLTKIPWKKYLKNAFYLQAATVLWDCDSDS